MGQQPKMRDCQRWIGELEAGRGSCCRKSEVLSELEGQQRKWTGQGTDKLTSSNVNLNLAELQKTHSSLETYASEVGRVKRNSSHQSAAFSWNDFGAVGRVRQRCRLTNTVTQTVTCPQKTTTFPVYLILQSYTKHREETENQIDS